MNRRNRGAFTLVELLVVITIISMLMALLLPAVQSARESGRRATCLNNQKNLSLANLNYESAHGQFPGYLQTVGQASQQYASWVVPLFPFVERNDLWERWRQFTVDTDLNAAGVVVSMNLLMCPSDVTAETGQEMSYAVNCGRIDELHYTTISGADVPDDTAAFGVFQLLTNTNLTPALTTRNERVSLDSISVKDGSSTTVLLGENVQAGPWLAVDSTSGKSLALEEYKLGIAYADPVNPSVGNEPVRINNNMDDPASTKTARPSSYHPGGCVISFCDGHQQFLNEQVEDNVYRHIMTPDSNKAGIPGVLDEDDF